MNIKKWKFVKRKELLVHPRMSIVEDRVVLPSNEEIDYIRVAPKQKPSVAIIAVRNNKILLQQEYSYPPDEVLWQLPGGCSNSNEDLLDAAKRELLEESGFVAGSLKEIGFFYTNNRRSDERQYVFVCEELQKSKASPDKEEFINNYWLGVDEVRVNIQSNEFKNVNLLAALNLYFSQKDII